MNLVDGLRLFADMQGDVSFDVWPSGVNSEPDVDFSDLNYNEQL
jgi:hypothetical protein